MTSETPQVVARRIIAAVIKKHGVEVFLGEGYGADATLFNGIVKALESAGESEILRWRSELLDKVHERLRTVDSDAPTAEAALMERIALLEAAARVAQ